MGKNNMIIYLKYWTCPLKQSLEIAQDTKFAAVIGLCLRFEWTYQVRDLKGVFFTSKISTCHTNLRVVKQRKQAKHN